MAQAGGDGVQVGVQAGCAVEGAAEEGEGGVRGAVLVDQDGRVVGGEVRGEELGGGGVGAEGGGEGLRGVKEGGGVGVGHFWGGFLGLGLDLGVGEKEGWKKGEVIVEVGKG